MKDYNTLHSEQERKEYDSEICLLIESGDLFLHFHPMYLFIPLPKETRPFFFFFFWSKIFSFRW